MGSISSPPTIRWGILGAGLISSWFVSDLYLVRNEAPVRHIVTAIGSSSIAKGQAFTEKNIPPTEYSAPIIYDSYSAVVNDPNVDIIYIGTPHSFHKQNCLDAIAGGKHVLCEKPFTINAKEAEEVIAAAKEKGVFVMEAMWTRFHPLVTELRKQLFVDKVIGDVKRTFCDFGMVMNIQSLGNGSRLKNRDLGAGSLLDIGIYSLTWGLLTLEEENLDDEPCEVKAAQTLVEGVDVATSMIIQFPKSRRVGILTSNLEVASEKTFCRIEGSHGSVVLEGIAASAPRKFTVYSKVEGARNGQGKDTLKELQNAREYSWDLEGMGFYFEADAVALDVLHGRVENDIMPLDQTLRVMKIMDEVRRQGGAKFAQDDVSR